MKVELRTTCNRDCPDACGILATVEDGRIVAHRGDPDHPMTRGRICRRGNHFLERQYHPDRIRHPLRRTAAGFERLAWDSALDLVAERLREVRAAHGPLGVAAITYSGMHGWVARVAWRLFWAHLGGASMASGGLSVEPILAAQALDLGADGTHDPEDLPNARAVVIWGKNPEVTHRLAARKIRAARAAGAPVWVIDVVPTATAHQADRFLQIRPGTDGVLALGVARCLLDRGQVDERFVVDYVNGLDAFRALARRRTLAEVAATTDVAVADLEALAELYGTRRPLATLVGLGAAYWPHGGAQVRIIDALAALTGNLGVPGGGAQSDLTFAPGLDLSVLRAAPRGARRDLPLPRLGEALAGAAEPPVRMAFVAGANPAATAPDAARVADALAALDSVVVVEQFHSATTAAAEVVLPVTTYLEARDLVTAYGHPFAGLTRAVVAPEGEARSDLEILQGLADRLGFGAVLAGTADAWIRRLVAPWAAAGVTLEALEAGACRIPGAPVVPFADGRFPTASGRFELTATDVPDPAPLAAGELHLVATKTVDMVNAQITPERLPRAAVARIHPVTLAALGLSAAEPVTVVSRVGRVPVVLAADVSLRPDVLLLNPARWAGDLQGVNQLREAVMTDLGGGVAFHGTRARIERGV